MRLSGFLTIVLLVFAGLCAEVRAQDAETAAFITLLGNDTLAVERFEVTPSGLTAEVVLRTPQTTYRRYDIRFDDQGGLERFESVIHDGGADADELRREVVTPTAGGLLIASSADDGATERTAEIDDSAFPFIDMVHWPFELALRTVAGRGVDSTVVPMFTGRGAIPFVFRRVGSGGMTIQHPFRGVMDVEVDAAGRLVHLDAGQTTRKLTVTRVDDVDPVAVAARFVAEDQAGRSFGALSGRGEFATTVGDANITIDFGQPSKRGRDIWGALVPFGELWRTGANLATHITTDRTLAFNGTVVEPGTYTLFSIPEGDGGVLIISSQTGQNGNSYNPEHDLGRVPMHVQPLDDVVEDFLIDAVPAPEGGQLRLLWDRTAYVIPFAIR